MLPFARMPMRRLWGLAIVGVLAGFLSGLFGVGGGIIIVPLLVGVLGFGQRLASGTSLTAILPTAVAGSIGYLANGNVDWAAAGVLTIGAVSGSLAGSWLLHRIPHTALRWLFIVFLVGLAIRMLFVLPDRGASLGYGPAVILGLVGLGLVTGLLSGLLGVGGGVIVVPGLMILFGMSDLVAKATSLLLMIPTSLAGTLANLRRGNTDLQAAVVISTLAIPASLGGVMVAAAIPPHTGTLLFAALMLATAAQLTYTLVARRRRR